jgi:antitoxin (DNA-binding transcriptional repressor) of toxin-antitoxin stability system
MANTIQSSRTGTMNIAGETFTVTQDGACTYYIIPTQQSFSSSGGTGSINVTTQSGCTWNASSNASWVTITSGSNGTGSGTVNYSVSANTSTIERTGMMTIAGQTFTVTQSAGSTCTYSISPTRQSFDANVGNSGVYVTASAGCAWTATSNASWISITSGSSGTGSSAVNYSVSANTNTSSRTGIMTIAGQTFTITQQGITCTYTIAPSNQSYNSNGGTGSITTQSNCAWTAQSNTTWITITSGSSGTGNGTVSCDTGRGTASRMFHLDGSDQ